MRLPQELQRVYNPPLICDDAQQDLETDFDVSNQRISYFLEKGDDMGNCRTEITAKKECVSPGEEVHQRRYNGV